VPCWLLKTVGVAYPTVLAMGALHESGLAGNALLPIVRLPPMKWLIILAAFDPDPADRAEVSIGRRIGLVLLFIGFAILALGALVIGICE